MSLMIKGARVFDGMKALEGLHDVIVEGFHINSIEPAGTRAHFQGQAVEAEEAWLLPGLIDLHVHLTWNGGADPAQVITVSSEQENLLETVANTLKYLPHGITSARDLGSPQDASLYVAKAVASGQLEGPRIFASGMSLIMTGGHDPFHGLAVDGPWEALKGTRAQVAKGASVIKISATGGVYGRESGEGVDDTELRQDELEMIINEAHRRNVPVTAHAIGEQGIRSCLAAGIDCIEHGHYIQKDMARQMQLQNTAYVPTLFIYQHLASSPGIPEYARKKASEVIKRHLQALRHSYEAGVLIGAGSDAGSPMAPHPILMDELLALAGAGLPNEYVLRTATAYAGQILRQKDRLGVIKTGALADLILIAGDPLEDLQALRQPKLVMINGKIVIS